MSEPSVLLVPRVVSLTALLVHVIAVHAADGPAKGVATGIELTCLSEQPAIVEGENATLQAWATTLDGRPLSVPISLEWDVDAGRIEDQAPVTRWDLSTVKIEPQATRRKVIATAKASQPGGSEARCAVEIFIGKKEAVIPDRGTLAGESLLSARHYLLPGKGEDLGYGLYSYLLLSTPPKDAEETARYLKTIEAYLLVLQDVDEYLSRHVRRKSLNTTYIPLKKIPNLGQSNAEWATNVLAVYDYAAAQILLSRVQQPHQDGPYLLSVLAPLSEPGTSAHLWEDLTGVVPELAWNWIRYFTYLAAQERSWSEDSLQRFGLKLHNLIAVGGRVTPATVQALDKAIRFKSKL